MNNSENIPVKVKTNSSIEELLRTQNYILPLVNNYETENEYVLTACISQSRKGYFNYVWCNSI